MNDNSRIKELVANIQNDGFDVRPVFSPTVPAGKERIRICIHAFNTEGEVEGLVRSLQKHVDAKRTASIL